MSNDITEKYISQIVIPPKEQGETKRLYFIKDKNAWNNIESLQSNVQSLNTEINTLDDKINNLDIPNSANLVSIDDLNNTITNLITREEVNNSYVKWSSLISNYTNNVSLANNYAHISNGVIDNASINYNNINGLNDNYAHLNNGIIDNATINYTDINNLNQNYAHINNGTIDNATISYTDINNLNDNYAHISNGLIDNANISYANIKDLNTNYAHISNGTIDNANIDYANINNLDTNYAHISNGVIDNASINYADVNELNSYYAHITNGTIDNANIDHSNINNLETNYAHIVDGVIDNASIDYADVNNLEANYAHISNGTIDNANIDYANVNNLESNYAHITNGRIDNANINSANVNDLYTNYAHINDGFIDNAFINYANVDQLDSHYAEIDMANVNNAWIENGIIKDAAISDAKILGVSANKLTAGKIDASNINVINLRADNLVVTKINGQPVIGGYTLVSPEILGYIDKNPSQENWYEFYNNLYTLTVDTIVDPNKNYYTTSDSVKLYDQNTIDQMFDNIDARIDSQIETWTVNEVPTLLNYPAEDWTTNNEKDQHIGDICYVVNAGNDYDGYTYRFAYDNTSNQYNWILIKDNQVTAALGRITDLETFETNTASWITQTDSGMETIRQETTRISGVATTAAQNASTALQTANDIPIISLSSTNGTVFKQNVGVSTVIIATIFTPGGKIDNSTTLQSRFGSTAYLQWGWRDVVTDATHIIPSNDTRILNNGFAFLVNPDDVNKQAVITCSLII